MEVVIKIPEEDFDHIKLVAEMQKKEAGLLLMPDSYTFIANGVPLPKGHGALKDADEVFAVMERNLDMQDLYLPIHFKQFALDEAQTIVPADKEGAE